MSRTRVQQSQISGSLSVDVSDSYVAANALTRAEGGSSTLVADLNDLRKQLNRIIGEGSWSAALAGEQDLSDIYSAMHVDASGNADFQGTLDVTGVATFDSAITGSAGLQLGGDLDVNSTADFQGAVVMQSSLDVDGAVDFDSTLDVAGVATFQSAITGSAGMQLAGDLDVNSSADFQGAVNLQDTLTVAGKADFAGIVDVAGTLSASAIKIDGDVAGRLYFVDPSTLEIQDSADLVFSAGALNITGALTASLGVSVGGDLDVAGPAVFQDGITISNGGAIIDGDRLEVTGSMGVTGAVDFDSTLNVDGAVTLGSTLNVSGKADFAGIVDVAGTLSASAVKIDGDVAQRLYIVDADGSLKDESKLTFDGSELWVDGDLEVAGGDITMSNTVSLASSAANKLVITAADEVELTGDLDVQGGKIFLSNGASVDSETAGKLLLTSDLVETSGDLKVAGNDISGSAGLNITLESAGDVTIAGDLKLMGNELKSSAGNVVLEMSGDDAFFKSDVHVAGDLYVKGAMTYIETTNLKVKDAFIHLATGSTGAENSGIVLHGGAGASADLMLAQDGGAGEFVFAKLLHSSQDHTDVDGDNSVVVNGAELVSAWMSSVKLGGVEGSLSGSLSATELGVSLNADSGDLFLESDASVVINAATNVDVAPTGDLLLAANSETSISFIESGEYAAFDAQFPGMSLVAAIVAAGGNFKQDSFLPGAVAANTAIDFEAALGFELRSAAVADDAAKKLAMDVYLNGVRLAYAEDYTVFSTTEIKLTMATVADDRLLIVVHNAL